MRFIVAQLGARMHYAVPRILAASGYLERLYTDFCSATGIARVLQFFPEALTNRAIRRILARRPTGVPLEQIFAFNGFGQWYACRLRAARTREQILSVHLWAGSQFCNDILKDNDAFGGAVGVYAFNSAALELLRAAATRGRNAVLEQTIAPMAVERKLLQLEQDRFPGWESQDFSGPCLSRFEDREFAEWESASQIICGSEFVRDGIAQCGGPRQKCTVVPYGFDVPVQRSKREPTECFCEGRPLRVLTVGAVGLRKGTPYVLQAAQALSRKLEFRMVGTIGVSAKAQAELQHYVSLLGPLPRCDLGEHYSWADVFLLPSICEGSSTATYEALAYGVPVICTNNTGSVIRDGVEGFIVPVASADAIVTKLELLSTDPALLDDLRQAALVRAQSFKMEAYGRRLLSALPLGLENHAC